MKKMFGIWLAVMILFAIGTAWAGNTASFMDPMAEDGEPVGADMAAEEAATDQSVQNNMGQSAGPAVRWDYPVSMTALYAPQCKLVDRDNLLTEQDEPASLVEMKVKCTTSAKVYLDTTAGEALENMFSAAKADGYTLFLKSGYRSYKTQKYMYYNRLEKNGGKEEFPAAIAYPGGSDHQLGLACDILNAEHAMRPRMTPDFAETAEAQWMKENCASFGFILCFPADKTEITKIMFEPWHFRYVGRAAAGYIMRKGYTMQEFTDEWQLAVAEFQGKGGDVEEQIAYEAQRQLSGPESTVFWDKRGTDGDPEVSLAFFTEP